MGPVPPRCADEAAGFVLADLEAHGVDTSLREEVAEAASDVGGADASGAPGLPTSAIVQSAATGSRTIISCRRGLRELGPAHFRARLPSLCASAGAALGWVHLEGRQYATVVEMAREVEARRSGGEAWRLSVELEKPVSLHVPLSSPDLLRAAQFCLQSSPRMPIGSPLDLPYTAPLNLPPVSPPRRLGSRRRSSS